MKKSVYQAIRLFLFSLLLPLLGLIINSLKSLSWEIVYDSPFFTHCYSSRIWFNKTCTLLNHRQSKNTRKLRSL